MTDDGCRGSAAPALMGAADDDRWHPGGRARRISKFERERATTIGWLSEQGFRWRGGDLRWQQPLSCVAVPPAPSQAPFSAGPVHEQRHPNFHHLTNKSIRKSDIGCCCSAKRPNRTSMGGPTQLLQMAVQARSACSMPVGHVFHVSSLDGDELGLCRSELGSRNRCWGIVWTKNTMLPW